MATRSGPKPLEDGEQRHSGGFCRSWTTKRILGLRLVFVGIHTRPRGEARCRWLLLWPPWLRRASRVCEVMALPVPLMQTEDSTCCDPPASARPLCSSSGHCLGYRPCSGPPAWTPCSGSLVSPAPVLPSNRRGAEPVSVLTPLCKPEDPLERFSETWSLTLALTHLLGSKLVISLSVLESKVDRQARCSKSDSRGGGGGDSFCFSSRAQRGEGPFVMHLGLATPMPPWPQIPLSAPQARGAGRGLQWGPWDVWNASRGDRPTLSSRSCDQGSIGDGFGAEVFTFFPVSGGSEECPPSLSPTS
ncbi:uncharacterized protein LOC102899466 [Felis catus]|uniref:uncharacterized protein LOC102899466 n=1 Tax=Felis catus TaxID=9685 RepID=UPI001D1A2682|nr:uncharacterized protein LOC102899466 [Felis catus]XP_044890990.1 uncharacterized protein LOC102899466 [Felis catus]